MTAREEPERRIPFRAEAGLVVLLTALGAVFRFAWFSGRMAEYPDEVTYWVCATRLLAHDTTPQVYARPLHSVIQAASLQVFGIEEWAFRLPMAVLGTLTIPLVYLIARRLFGLAPAAFAAFAFAISARAIESSRSALAESDALFFLMAGALVYLVSTRTEPTRPPWLAAGAGILLGLSLVCHPVTVYFVLAVVLAAAVVVAVSGPGRSARLFSLCVMVVAIAIPGWVYEIVFAKLRFVPGWKLDELSYYERVFFLRSYMEHYNPAEVRRGLVMYVRYLQLADPQWVLGLLFGVGSLSCVHQAVRRRDPKLFLPLVMWGVPVALWAWVVPMLGITRNVHSAIGPQAILVGLGMAAVLRLARLRLGPRPLAPAATGGVMGRLPPRWPILMVAAPALLVAVALPALDCLRNAVTQRTNVIRQAYDAIGGQPAVFYPPWSGHVLGRLFVGQDKFRSVDSPEALSREQPAPRFAAYYGSSPATEDWLRNSLALVPVVEGRTYDNYYTVRVYDMSGVTMRPSREVELNKQGWESLAGHATVDSLPASERASLLFARVELESDRFADGDPVAPAALTDRGHICRKVLWLPVEPSLLKGAAVKYYIQINPLVLGRGVYLRRNAPDPRVNLLIDVNGRRVFSQTVAESATQGWHVATISPGALKQGPNEITFRLSDDRRVAVSLGITPRVTDGRSSFASSDGGSKWTSDILSPEHIGLGKPMRGEYIVRLLLRPKNESGLSMPLSRSAHRQ